MQFKKSLIAMFVGAAVAAPAAAHDGQTLNWAGSIYMKFLDGSLLTNNGGYSVGGTYVNAPNGGDQGQLTEFELLLSGKISREVEFGGRIKSRFNRNYWSNFGGFGPGDEVDNPDQEGKNADAVESAQYVKLRGAYVMINPGYDWLDLLTIGSNDFNQFNPYTLGGLRYTDRDNAAGFVAQGKLTDEIRWDVARIALPKLWAGPLWQTTATVKSDRDSYGSDLFGNDAGHIAQLKYAGDVMSGDFVVMHVLDEEKKLDPDQAEKDIKVLVSNPDLTTESMVRTKNLVFGGSLKLETDAVTFGVTGYRSDWHIGDEFGYTLQDDADTAEVGDLVMKQGFYIRNDLEPDARLQWSPTLMFSETDGLFKLNVDASLEELGIMDGLNVSAELFHIGAHYQSVLAARREKDVLLTEGRDGAWMWRGAAEVSGGMGMGGWFGTMRGPGGFDGATQQVATLNVDNEFSDFDEIAAQSVIGWQGFTIAPSLEADDWTFGGEYSYITYDSNWQAYGMCDDATNCLDLVTSNDNLYPVMEGDANFGFANTYRAAYAPFQDKTTHIAVARASTTFDFGEGLDFWLKFKMVSETDKRVTEEGVSDYKAARARAGETISDDDAVAAIFGAVYNSKMAGYVDNEDDRDYKGDLSLDDREYSSILLEPAVGYALHEHLYAKLTWSHYQIDLDDGDYNVDFQTRSFWKNYLTGKTQRDSFMLALSYVLPGFEVGSSINQIYNAYTPEFTENGSDLDTSGEDSIKTAIQKKKVSVDTINTRQYRMKTWVKVVF